MNKRKTVEYSFLFAVIIGLAFGLVEKTNRMEKLIETQSKELTGYKSRVASIERMVVDLQDKFSVKKEDEPTPEEEIVYKPEIIKARVTAYAPLDNKSGICAEGNPAVTATGTKSRRGVVAVDPNKIPYGSRLFIPGYGEAIAEDTGGALRRYDGIAVDILVDSYSEAMSWGKQYIDIVILERGDKSE